MRCPACPDTALVERPTLRGLVIDSCPRCRGTWLDRGEILLFGADARLIEAEIARHDAPRGASSGRSCPRCRQALHERPLLSPDLLVDECPSCEGLWLDAGELRRAMSLPGSPLRDAAEASDGGTWARRSAGAWGRAKRDALRPGAPNEERNARRLAAIAAGRLPLPNLLARSLATLLLLYALLGLGLIALVEQGHISSDAALLVGLVVLVIQYVLAPWIMDLMMRWLYRVEWVGIEGIPPHLREFVEDVARKERMPLPRFGVIPDGAPNAFTYGHVPQDMRLVVTRGIFELLEPGEVEAVVAHEMGHGKHWDVALMTAAQVVPLLLYHVYRSTVRARSGRRGRGAKGGPAIAAGAYLLYLVSQYVVLWFARGRELHADRFSGRVTGDPNLLASALVKIAYGLSARPGASTDAEASKHAAHADALSPLGIFDVRVARSLVMAANGSRPADAPGGVGAENLEGAMQWDLWNPWAAYHELHSTHPLVARRLQHLADQSAAVGRTPYAVFDRRQPESYWDEFAVDLLVLLLPAAAAAAVFAAAMLAGGRAGAPAPAWLALAVGALGLGQLVKLAFTHCRRHFAPMSVAGLSHAVKVSSVRPIPARLRGRVIGRGVPGLIWSEDFVLQDPTGILFLDYRQPLRLWEWLFGLLRAGDFTGREVTVSGWYRRAPVPYLEIWSLTEGGRTRRCFALHAKVFVAFCLALFGLGAACFLALAA